MNDNRTEIIELLRSTNRPGIEDVIVWLDTAPSFFEASGARILYGSTQHPVSSKPQVPEFTMITW